MYLICLAFKGTSSGRFMRPGGSRFKGPQKFETTFELSYSNCTVNILLLFSLYIVSFIMEIFIVIYFYWCCVSRNKITEHPPTLRVFSSLNATKISTSRSYYATLVKVLKGPVAPDFWGLFWPTWIGSGLGKEPLLVSKIFCCSFDFWQPFKSCEAFHTKISRRFREFSRWIDKCGHRFSEISYFFPGELLARSKFFSEMNLQIVNIFLERRSQNWQICQQVFNKILQLQYSTHNHDVYCINCCYISFQQS